MILVFLCARDMSAADDLASVANHECLFFFFGHGEVSRVRISARLGDHDLGGVPLCLGIARVLLILGSIFLCLPSHHAM